MKTDFDTPSNSEGEPSVVLDTATHTKLVALLSKEPSKALSVEASSSLRP